MDPVWEKVIADFEEWLDEVKFQQDSDTDSDDHPSLRCPIEITERRRPAPTFPEATPNATTREWSSQGSSSSQNRTTIEAEKNKMSVYQEIYYLSLLTEINIATTSEKQKEAHDGQMFGYAINWAYLSLKSCYLNLYVIFF